MSYADDTTISDLQSAVNRSLQAQDVSWKQYEIENTDFQAPVFIEDQTGVPSPAAFFDVHVVEFLGKETVTGYGKDFSGIVFSQFTRTYFIIDDRCRIIEIDTGPGGGSFNILRQINLKGLDDCEAIALTGRGSKEEFEIVVAEERRGNLAFMELSEKTQEISFNSKDRIKHVMNVGPFWQRNRGIEALAIDGSDQEEQVFYIGKEEMPRKILKGKISGDVLNLRIPWNAENLLPMGSDIAEMTFYEGMLFLVNERQGFVYQIDPDVGNIISSFKLPGAGREQYEGISFSPLSSTEHEMILVSEKSNVWLFRVTAKD